jgi:hypothetical protein
MPRRKWTVDELLAAFISLSPADQAAFLLAARKSLSPAREFLLGVDMVGDPNGAFRGLLHVAAMQDRLLKRYHPRTQAQRDAELTDRHEAGETQSSLAEEYEMREGAVAQAIRRERRRREAAKHG